MSTMSSPKLVLVTGATGFIGAHIVDQLLEKGIRVRGTTRSKEKGELMTQARPQHASKLEFVQIRDFEDNADFSEAVKGVDAIIHVASPLKYDIKSNEQELILPAINGVRAILNAATTNPEIRRIVLTSSFASVMDASADHGPDFVYKGSDWNPLTYEESIASDTPSFIAYRGSKKFAELEAWNFVKQNNPKFDLVTLCPPMTFGPVVHPINSAAQLNESNEKLWSVIGADAKDLPQSRVPVWIDVRDLAKAHVEALLRPEAGMKRYVPASLEKFSYELAAKIIREEFPWANESVADVGDVHIPPSYGLDGATVTKELGVEYHTFRQTVTDLVKQLKSWE